MTNEFGTPLKRKSSLLQEEIEIVYPWLVFYRNNPSILSPRIKSLDILSMPLGRDHLVVSWILIAWGLITPMKSCAKENENEQVVLALPMKFEETHDCLEIWR